MSQISGLGFPAIATGAYGFPSALAAQIAVTTLRSVPTEVECIRLVAFDTTTRDLLQAALGS